MVMVLSLYLVIAVITNKWTHERDVAKKFVLNEYTAFYEFVDKSIEFRLFNVPYNIRPVYFHLPNEGASWLVNRAALCKVLNEKDVAVLDEAHMRIYKIIYLHQRILNRNINLELKAHEDSKELYLDCFSVKDNVEVQAYFKALNDFDSFYLRDLSLTLHALEDKK